MAWDLLGFYTLLCRGLKELRSILSKASLGCPEPGSISTTSGSNSKGIHIVNPSISDHLRITVSNTESESLSKHERTIDSFDGYR